MNELILNKIKEMDNVFGGWKCLENLLGEANYVALKEFFQKSLEEIYVEGYKKAKKEYEK